MFSKNVLISTVLNFWSNSNFIVLTDLILSQRDKLENGIGPQSPLKPPYPTGPFLFPSETYLSGFPEKNTSIKAALWQKDQGRKTKNMISFQHTVDRHL
jgi:hypothetical protein